MPIDLRVNSEVGGRQMCVWKKVLCLQWPCGGLEEHDRQDGVGVPYSFLYRQRAAGSCEVRGCVGAKRYNRFRVKVEFR